MTRVMNVANKTPKPREIAIGTIMTASFEVSNIMGMSPMNVVSVVNKIGLKR